MSIDDSAFLQMAAQVASTGHLDIAKQTVNDLLAHRDNNPEAYRLLAKIEFSLGDVPAGSAAMNAAIRLAPTRADLRYEFGTMLAAKGDYVGACQELKAATQLAPKNQDFQYNLGCALSAIGQHQAACIAFNRVIELDPSYARAWQNLGYSRLSLGEWDEAAAAFSKAIEADPESHESVVGLGVALRGAGRDDEADTLFAENVENNPTGQAVIRLSSFELQRSNGKDVIEALYAAHRADPKSPEPLVQLAIALDRASRLPEIALPLIAAAIEHPEHGKLMCMAGIALVKIGEINDQTESVLLRGAALMPDHAGAMDALAHLYFARGEIEKAMRWYYAAHQANPTNASIHSNFLFTLRHSSGFTSEEVFEAHKEFGRIHESMVGPLPLPAPTAADKDRRLRLGFVSPDFCLHVVMMFFEPYLDNFDREQFEIFLYYTNGHSDDVTKRVKAKADGWRDLHRLSFEDSAKLIQDDKIDILFDLAGHTAKNGLPIFAYKPAPIQISWIGYPGTTGMTRMDYRIANENQQQVSTEKCIAAFGSPFQTPPDAPEVGPLPALEGKAFTFACMNKVLKASPEAIEAWAAIVQSVPNSRLVVMAASTDAAVTQQRIVPVFEEYGIDPSRIVIQARLPMKDFLAFHNQVDLALDPFPYGGGTTSRLSVYMGLPFVTLRGTEDSSQTGAQLMDRLKLTEFVAGSVAEYVEIATGMARDLEKLAAVRSSLRETFLADPMFSGKAAGEHFGMLLRKLWADYVTANAV